MTTQFLLFARKRRISWFIAPESVLPLTLMLALLAGPSTQAAQADKADRIARGEYLVGLLACGRCHTDGALIQKPNLEMFLAGSDTGIAYTAFVEGEQPGVVFPPNLTSDADTGLGNWSTPEIINAIRKGISKHGKQEKRIMPWAGYAYLKDEDALAIANYLQSLPPIKHRVPRNVEAGKPSNQDFVRFGIYHFRAAKK